MMSNVVTTTLAAPTTIGGFTFDTLGNLVFDGALESFAGVTLLRHLTNSNGVFLANDTILFDDLSGMTVTDVNNGGDPALVITLAGDFRCGVGRAYNDSGGGNIVIDDHRYVDQNNVTILAGVQQAAVANATGAGDIVAQFNALLARLRGSTGHGLIAG